MLAVEAAAQCTFGHSRLCHLEVPELYQYGNEAGVNSIGGIIKAAVKRAT